LIASAETLPTGRRGQITAVGVMLAVIIGLGILSTSILRVYGQSHYDYLTRVSVSSPQAGFS